METESRNALLFERFKDMLSSAPKRVYTGSDLTHLVEKLRADFGFPRSLSILKFQRSLIENGRDSEGVLTQTGIKQAFSRMAPATAPRVCVSLHPNRYIA
jgi:hypothetical protein